MLTYGIRLKRVETTAHVLSQMRIKKINRNNNYSFIVNKVASFSKRFSQSNGKVSSVLF